MASSKKPSSAVEDALRKVITDLESDQARLNREVAQLRRQVVELEKNLTAERTRVREVLNIVKSDFAETLEKCELAATKPRDIEEKHDDLEDDDTHHHGGDGSPRRLAEENLPQVCASHGDYPWYKLPMRRRLQTLFTLLFTWTTPLLWSSIALFYIAFSRNYYSISCVFIYLGWMFLLDDETPRTGRPWWMVRRLRSFSVWKLCAEFYPIQLVRTAELSPEKNYMFCLHPHGVFSLTHAINFASNGTGFLDLFPGVKCLLATLRQQFKVPFHREYLMSLGTIEVSREALQNTLTRGPGWSVALVPGGAQEALEAFNGTMRLVLLKRKGFIRVALRTGASLVPVLSYGENDLYLAQKGMKRMMIMTLWTKLLKKCYGFTSPSAMGRGVFNRNCPDPFMIPFRKPVTTVVGRPIELPRIPEPLPTDVDYWHAKYIEALKELFEQTAPKYGPGLTLELL